MAKGCRSINATVLKDSLLRKELVNATKEIPISLKRFFFITSLLLLLFPLYITTGPVYSLSRYWLISGIPSLRPLRLRTAKIVSATFPPPYTDPDMGSQ